ncbi:hypothetical protein ABLE93_08760 [Xanthobacter sp. KR7-65]|uniref:hypothetical protein n=1 Tax=Xanthobacter sp. KR7-65 TaxID=3156612 RepID=UPI0032B4F562
MAKKPGNYSDGIRINTSGGRDGDGGSPNEGGAGSGGNAGAATLYVGMGISVSGAYSNGITVLAAGGNGGIALEDKDDVRYAGGNGGNGGAVVVHASGDITASGAGAMGILINSSGGSVNTSSYYSQLRTAGSAGTVTSSAPAT